MPPLDFRLMAQSLYQPVGDVVPFGRKSLEPGMGLTEGARPYGGGANPRGGVVVPIERAGKPMTQYQEPNKYYNANEMEIGGILEGALGRKSGTFTKSTPAGSPEWNVSYAKLYGTPEQKQWLETPDGKYFSSQYVSKYSGKATSRGEKVPSFGEWIRTEIDRLDPQGK